MPRTATKRNQKLTKVTKALRLWNLCCLLCVSPTSGNVPNRVVWWIVPHETQPNGVKDLEMEIVPNRVLTQLLCNHALLKCVTLYFFRARWYWVFSCPPIPCWTIPCQVQGYNRVDMVWEHSCVQTIRVSELILPVARTHLCASRRCNKLFVHCWALLHRQQVRYDVTS